MSRYELKVTQEFSDHVVVEAESEAEAKCLVEDCVADERVSAIDIRGVKGGGYQGYDFRVEPLYQTNDPVTIVIKENGE